MGAQTIITESGEELVVLSRREYDSLLASLGDDEAEDRVAARIITASQEAVARGDEILLPGDFVKHVLGGENVIAAARTHLGFDLATVASASGLPPDELFRLESGTRAPTLEERSRIAAALGVDPRWLDPLAD